LSNRNNYDPARIVQAAFALFGEQPAKEPAHEIKLDDAALASYAGRYIMHSALPTEAAEEVIVAVQGGRLTAALPGVTFMLRAVGADLFDVYAPGMDEPMTQLAFLRANTGGTNTEGTDTGAIQYMSFTMHALRRAAQ
jgi:hypothetical protein